MKTAEPDQGKIITFYSYKGGTGRSMAVANMACWLSRKLAGSSDRVLLMDWDLEAPGLHRYFAHQTEKPENSDRPGLINYFDDLQSELKADPGLYQAITGANGAEALEEVVPLKDHLILDVSERVDLLKAGRQDAPEYAERINAFDWIEFFDRYGGVIETFRQLITARYGYCLIDSRTGFTDVSGICTMLMPEKLVTVFTPNRQSLSGVLSLARRAINYRLASNDFRSLSIFPLPSRIENNELELKKKWRDTYQSEFEYVFKKIYQLEECDLSAYFDDVQLPQISYYAYGEEIALLEERSDSLSLRRAYEVFFKRLDSLGEAWASPTEAKAAAHSYEVTLPGQKSLRYDNEVFISYAHMDDQAFEPDKRGWVDHFHEMLRLRLSQLLGTDVKIWRDRMVVAGEWFSAEISEQLGKSAAFVAILSPSYLHSKFCR